MNRKKSTWETPSKRTLHLSDTTLDGLTMPYEINLEFVGYTLQAFPANILPYFLDRFKIFWELGFTFYVFTA